ncbi:gliding motility-associated C-terminal domain-containing protein [Fulvivirgaceae bacterium LMO-SS25]
MKRQLGLSLFFLIISFFSFLKVEATHIRAGEIIATRLPGPTLTYRITVIAYRDTGSPVPFGAGNLNFGDGRIVNLEQASQIAGNSFVRTDLGNSVESNIVTIIHTFQGAGFYTISYGEDFRNEFVLNMIESVTTPFYVETQLLVDPFLTVTNTPELLVPPVDRGCTNVRFIHNPGAFDLDGDSIAYKLVVPKQTRTREVNGYRPPNDPIFGGTTQDGTGAPTFTLDSITGDLIWDSPGTTGEYNVAFIVEEWRRINGEFVRIGYVTRDLQIIIEDCNNDPPDVQIPQDICVVAGTLITEEILGIDPNGDPILLESFAGIYDIGSGSATFSPITDDFRPSPASSTFTWQTDCSHVRLRPYQVQFKVTDNPLSGPNLVNIKTWNITVIAPAPELQSVVQSPGKVVDLEWDPYDCFANAESLEIYRRIGSNPYEPDECETGIRSGYELIGSVDPSDTAFTDDTFPNGPVVGNMYCYRIFARFPQPGGGESIVSREICTMINVDVPILTNVDVRETDNSNGQIFVKWTSPFEIDVERFPPPFTYELFRLENLEGESNKTLVTSTQDTVFLDTNLNTEDLAYRYQVNLLTSENELLDSSSIASSVRLTASQSTNLIDLTWEYNVSWNNETEDFPYHYIYRNKINPNDPDAFVLIDSVNVLTGGLEYTDSNDQGRELIPDEIYCYFVSTQGTYDMEEIPRPLINNSQIACQTPKDITAPCAPVLELTTPDCEEFFADKECGYRGDFFNSFSWTPTISEECEDDIVSFKIYFSSTGPDGDFQEIATVPAEDREFIHEQLASFEGCYVITAIDEAGNESEFSNVICNENCPQYDLPNVFTPNGDGSNDTFRAIGNPLSACPRFVESVRVKIVNRWGMEVFSYQSNTAEGIFINWDGRDMDGNELPAGTYYYQGEVTFITNDPSQRSRELKGWVQMMR